MPDEESAIEVRKKDMEEKQEEKDMVEKDTVEKQEVEKAKGTEKAKEEASQEDGTKGPEKAKEDCTKLTCGGADKDMKMEQDTRMEQEIGVGGQSHRRGATVAYAHLGV